MLKSKSAELAKRLGQTEFKPKDGCLPRLKCRFWIEFKKPHGKEGGTDAVIAEQLKFIKLPNLLYM
jgi:hypothetical protein